MQISVRKHYIQLTIKDKSGPILFFRRDTRW